MTDTKAIRALFPGTTYQIDERVHVTVYPLGVPQIRLFTDKLVGAFSAVAKSGMRTGRSEADVGAQFVGTLLPHVVTSMTDVLDKCVAVEVYATPEDTKPTTVQVSDLPHHYLPPIAEHWIKESFGDEGKREPWLQAVRGIWGTMSEDGEEVSISEMWSRFVSGPATPTTPSST